MSVALNANEWQLTTPTFTSGCGLDFLWFGSNAYPDMAETDAYIQEFKPYVMSHGGGGDSNWWCKHIKENILGVWGIHIFIRKTTLLNM